MSIGAARQRMTMRATVQRLSAGTDPFGGPSGTWQTHIASLACWTYQRIDRAAESVDEGQGNRTVVIDDLRLQVPLGTDIRASDRILQVIDRRGSSLFPYQINIRGVSRHSDHLEVVGETAHG